MAEIFISVDIETDGPIPGPHSMLSFGAAAYVDRKLRDTFTANLELLPGAAPDPETAAWWEKNPEAYVKTRRDLAAPEKAMQDFVAWVDSIGKRPVFAAFPAGFDFTFMYWYMIRFAGRSPFSFSALDMKTLAMATLGIPYREAVKRNLPRDWFAPGKRHEHVALSDAIEQGEMLMKILAVKDRQEH
ncbi:MAG: 3'-5' exoribonuclease [Proteobacteria bacterium]|nr:3'-5' exoribonuclease [Pseudomonadota bacterium]